MLDGDTTKLIESLSATSPYRSKAKLFTLSLETNMEIVKEKYKTYLFIVKKKARLFPALL